MVRSPNGGVVVQHLGRRPVNKLVTPRRGTHKGGECEELPCPDVGVFRCLSFVAERLYSVARRDVASEGISEVYKQR